jgi:hypothetical protein
MSTYALCADCLERIRAVPLSCARFAHCTGCGEWHDDARTVPPEVAWSAWLPEPGAMVDALIESP